MCVWHRLPNLALFWCAGNGNILATVTSIICGLGSLGCAIGPTLAGHLIHKSRDGLDFSTMFIVLTGMALLSGIALMKPAVKEVGEKRVDVYTLPMQPQ